jgi:methionyl-tRNA formyltransferase
VRLVFAGTPPFAATALEALAHAGHEIALVLTQPDRPAGRGMRLTASAVARTAGNLRVEVAKPSSLRSDEAQAMLRAARPDVMVVAAYGLLLPQAVLDIPPGGCLNIHASLLPRWRGAAPVQRAILAGDDVTGVCIMRMEAGLDTGPVLLRREHPIERHVTAGELTEALARLGAAAIVEALDRLDELEPQAQDAAGATYAAKISKAEARLDWGQDAAQVHRHVRAFNPSPGAETVMLGQPLKIWEVEPLDGRGTAGTVLEVAAQGIVVACGSGAVRIRELQRPGARRMRAEEFLRGAEMAPGMSLQASIA